MKIDFSMSLSNLSYFNCYRPCFSSKRHEHNDWRWWSGTEGKLNLVDLTIYSI